MTLSNLWWFLAATLRFARRTLLNQAKEHPWALAVALYSLARSFGVMVQTGQRAVLFRWGRAVMELEPGFHWLIPVVHAVRLTPVRSVTLAVPEQKIMTDDGLVYDAGVNFVYRIEDATRALTLVDHLDQACRAVIPIAVVELLRVRTQAELADRASLDHELSERIQATVRRWGLVVEQAGFTTLAPNHGVLLTTQLRARTNERAYALRSMLSAGLEPDAALILIGSERHPVGASAAGYKAQARRRSAWLARPRESATPLPVTRPPGASPKSKGTPHAKGTKSQPGAVDGSVPASASRSVNASPTPSPSGRSARGAWRRASRRPRRT